MKSRAGYFWMLLLLVILLPMPTWAARQVHYFGCNDCHRAGMPLGNLNNLCMKCHNASTGVGTTLNDGTPSAHPTRKFLPEDASNSLGTLATIPGYTYVEATAKEISHLWGVNDTNLSAGATPPTDPLLVGKNSRGKIYCARCHNSHNQDTVDRKLLKIDNSADQMCMDCHTSWYVNNVNANLTHPVGVNYATVLSGDTDGRFEPVIVNVGAGDVRLVQGTVSCTSCHGMHFTDSDSSTVDSYTNQAIMDGDGHQLRTDGPTRANKSTLCKTCHTYLEHGKMADGGESVGCLVCHSGHSYDATAPNYYVLRKSVTTSTFGAKTTLVPTSTVNYLSYCTACHGPVTGYASRSHNASEVCSSCHVHSTAVYSFAMTSNGKICGDCHGAPPRSADVSIRSDVTMGTGYAVGPDVSYISSGQNYKIETNTPHKLHSGALNEDKTAVDYAFGAPLTTLDTACLPCHNDFPDTVTKTHDTGISSGSFQDVYFDSSATYNGVLSPAYKMTSPNQWTCSNVYCHSNGGKRRTDGGAKQLADFETTMTPAWLNGSSPRTIVGLGTECRSCHGENRATMAIGTGATERNNSVTHIKHLEKLGDSKNTCHYCHADTAQADGTIPATARDHRTGTGGRHVNGTVDVVFDGLVWATKLASGTYTGGTAGTCTVYCHSNGKGVPASTTPDWDAAATGACGTCHPATNATQTSSSHARHLNPAKANIKCDACHGSGASAGTHSGHVDGVITKLSVATSCDQCHGVETAQGDSSPTWGDTGSINCKTCHTGSVLTSYVKADNVTTVSVSTANRLDKTLAATKGHGLPSASQYAMTEISGGNKDCSACHTTIGAGGHVDGIGNSKLLVGGFSCESCHSAGGSRTAEATVDVATHSGTKYVTFTKACLACHDPHGTSNLAMIENLRTVQNGKDASGTAYNGDVVFTSVTKTGTDSFDENDAANADDLCATCHVNTTHNSRTLFGNHAGGNYNGTDCTTTCHPHSDGFQPAAGSACNGCHGFPPNSGAHGDGASFVIHANTTSNDKDVEDRTDCEVCHTGAASYTYSDSLDRANSLNHGNDPGRLTILFNTVGYQKDSVSKKWFCSNACHQSNTSDGFWYIWDDVADPTRTALTRTGMDTVLDCNSCHYWNSNPTGGGNVTIGKSEAVSLTHNKHFDSGRLCITCHTNNAADTVAPHTHITDNELWTLNNSNDGSVLNDRGNATPDEATVTVSSWNDGTDNCSNAACHNPSGLTKSATWGTPNAQGCDFCHSSTNPDAGKGTPGSHGDHMGAAANFGITVTCTSCHPNNTSNAHLNSAVNLNGGFAYTTSLTDYTSSTYGRCTTTTCHNNGRGTAVQTPVWGVDSADCTICHAAPPVMTNNRHAEHVANTGYVANPNACGKCHLLALATQITATTHIDGTRNVGSQITDMDLVTGGNQLVAPGGWNGTCANACHLVDTTGTWTDVAANKLACLECHASGKIGGAPASGLHVGPLTVSANPHDDSFKITRNEATPSGSCLTCHSGIDISNDLPATHVGGGAPAPAQAALATTINYLGGTPSTCGPNGAMVNCHDDKGVWKRRWNTTARNNDGTQCGNCHGNFDLTWVTGISQRHGSDAQIHGGHNGAGVNDCYICHTFGWAATYPDATNAKHRDGNIQLNNGMLFNDDGATVHCTGCHDTKPLGLADGQYSFQDTNNADGADGGLNRWGRVEQAGPPANCNGCHAITNGLDHDGTNESLAVHDYHTGSPLAPGCGACHPADSGPGGALHQNNSLDFGGTYLSLTAYSVTPGVGGNFINTNCSTANGCHDSELNSWKNDTLASCGDCHAATTKLMYTGSGLSGYPPTSNEHDIHRANDAYVGSTPTNDCDDCHGTGASAPGHLAAHNDGALTVVATGSKITQLNADKSCTNSCHATASGRDWDSATTLDCVDCHQFGSSYIGEATKPTRTAPNGLHKATAATAHNDNFGAGGTCTSCHTGINLTTPVTHVNGSAVDANTTYGLFANYSTANGTCTAPACHDDGGDWARKWIGVVDAKPLETDVATAAVCGNCHGSFAQGWRFANEGNASTTDHTDPDADNSGDQLNTSGHQVCSACHGWGNATYDSGNKHQNSSLTMNADLGYTDGTGGCTTNCHHGLTLTMKTNSGFTTETAAYGGVGCGGCHDDGALPPNSGAHAAHAADADADYTECEACHGTDNGGNWATGNGGAHNKGTVNFAVGITYSNGGTPGTNAAAANDTCTTTQCHSAAGNPATWGTPASVGCNACHYYEPAPTKNNNAGNANALSATHGAHFDKGKVCIDCHGTLPTNRTHIAPKAGVDGVALTSKANAAQNDADPVSRSGMAWDDNLNTCSGGGIANGCHNTKDTPAWGSTGIGCTACHDPAGSAAADPKSGLHNMTATNVQKHNSNLRTGCTECHASMTGDPSSHIDGIWEADSNANQSGLQPRFLSGTRTGMVYSEGAVNSSTCWDNGASGASTSLDFNAGAGCHQDNGVWKRLWSTNANVDTQANPNPGELVCDVCHGQFEDSLNANDKGWREGTVHYASGSGWNEDKGKSHNKSGGVTNQCKDCHAYLNTRHEDGYLNFSGNGTTDYVLTNNAGKLYCASCHNGDSGESATVTDTHTYLPSGVFGISVTYVPGTEPPEGGCTGCHGNAGTGQYWPDGVVDNPSYPWADNQVGAHTVHVDEIAAFMDGNKLTPGTLTDKNATCNYCHPNPGGSGHSTDSGDQRVDLLGNGLFRYIIDGTTNGSGEYNYDTDGTCSTLKCHARAPFTPGWYGDTVAPGNVTLYAEAGPVPRSIRLYWDAPGDDGFVDGTAYKYDIRMGETSGAATNFDPSPLATNYVKGVPTVTRKGDTGDPLDDQQAIIHGVDPNKTYYFALRTYDEVGNYGGTANGGGYVSYTTPANTILDDHAPVLTGSPSWYGLDSAKTLDSSGTVKLNWTRAEDHSMPITYDVWWSTGNITYGTPNASTKDTSFRVTGLTDGQTYNFAVRAKDAYNNTDTNTYVKQTIPQGLSTVPKSYVSYYANGTATSNIPMLATVHTTDGTTATMPAVFIGPTNITSVTDIITSSFSVNVVNTNVATTLRAELGYITGASTWNSFNSATAGQTQLFATDVIVAKRATRLVTFKFNGATRRINTAMAALPVKLGVRVSVSSGAVTSIGWGPTSKGGILSFAQQPINTSPTTPTVSATVSGAKVNISWAQSYDDTDGVNDTVHYDVYGDDGVTLPGTFPYLIASGLTANATVGAPLVWDTQAAGIALGAQNSTVRVRVEAGDVVSGKVLSHTPSTSGNLTVNNSGDNVAPGTINNFKAETRPKQGSVYLSWTSPGDDGTNNGRALSYDIRYATAVIDNDTKYNAATPLVSEPYPDFGGNGQGYEVLGLADGNYYFAIKAVDEGAKTSPLAYTALTTASGPKCGICHATPPNEWNAKGNHAKHGYTMNDCGNCHGSAAKTFATNHQDGSVKLGWKTDTPQPATVNPDNSIVYTQGGQTIYTDASGGGFNVELDDLSGDLIDNGTCFSWSTLNVSGCHGPAASASWDKTATLVCSSCHGVASRPTDFYDHSFDDPSDDVKSAPPVDNHGFDGLPTDPIEERKYVGAHVPHLNYSFRLSKGDSCRMCHGASRPGSSLHADGNIDVKLDPAAAGDTALWTPGTPTTAGSCTSLSLDSCHPKDVTSGGTAPTPLWDSAQNFDCRWCHGMDGSTPPHTTDPGKNINLIDNDPDVDVDPLVDPMPGNCTWCHVGGHPKEKKVTAITKASPAVVTTENAHNLATNDKITIHTQTGMTEINNKTFSVTVINATQFSLQGSNSTTYGTFDYGTWIEGNGTGIILIPNDSRSGINYTSGGVHLKAAIGGRAEQGSEAELCWSCHDQNNDGDLLDATDVSEWGADGNPFARTDNTTATTDPGNGNDYNYGTLTTRSWIGATWTSAVTGTYGFGYKSGTIRSTHSTDATGTAALRAATSAYDYAARADGEAVDAVNKIHCSNCHDVHNSTNSPMEADGLNPDGAPYLRGTWKSNPYKEDGAPQAGQTYTAQSISTLPGYGYGSVPRANPATTQEMGGFWIDQNSNYPTAGWTYETSAALCQLCHSKTVDNLDQVPSENLWISATNGHANSALGGSGTGAANIFLQGVAGGRNGTIGTVGGGPTAGVNPNVGGWMGFQNTNDSTSTDYGYGPRSGDAGYLAPTQVAKVLMSKLNFAWGNAVDNNTVEVGYHSFSCSKCHNPHASRLPKLMITNCLDVAWNTWDNNYKVDATDWPKFNTTLSSWGRNRISHLSTAQNCHRYIDINNDNTPDEKGWNKVTPWGTNNP